MLISSPKSQWPAQHLHLTMGGTHPPPCQKGMLNTHIWPWEEHIQEPCQKGPTLKITSMIGYTYYHLWKGPALTTINMIGHTYYHLWKGPTLTITSMVGRTYYHIWKVPALIITSIIGHTYYHLWKDSALTTDLVGSNPTIISEWICTYIWSCGRKSHSHIIMALHLHLTMQGTNPITMSKGLTVSSLPLGRNLDLENTKLLAKALKL